jgi:hypothetical protein
MMGWGSELTSWAVGVGFLDQAWQRGAVKIELRRPYTVAMGEVEVWGGQ